MEQATSIPGFADIAKMLEQFKLPGIDVAALVDARRKDIEALVAANRLALEGAQTLGQKQADMLRQTLEQARAAIHEASTAGASREALAKSGEAFQQMLQTTLSNMRELADTAYKTQADAFAVVNARLQENVEALKASLKPKGQ
jgi:phasin family protein